MNETISQIIARNYAKRAEQLRSIDAPKIMVEAAERNVEAILAGDKKVVAHLDEFGHLEALSYTTGKGRGGKVYVMFETVEGTVYYFPAGRFGPFLSKKEEK